jgi:glutaredoxin 3
MVSRAAIQELIKKTPVLVYSKTYCPYCKNAKSLLRSKGVDFTAIELDKEADGQETQNILQEITKQSTVPNIFIKGVHIGGSSDLTALEKSGKLTAML